MLAEELNTFREAEQEAPWRAAMAEEMRAIHENDTWELASLPAGHRAIGLKWVYKVRPARSCDTRRAWWPRATFSAPASTSMRSSRRSLDWSLCT
jgi:hypothetical protein